MDELFSDWNFRRLFPWVATDVIFIFLRPLSSFSWRARDLPLRGSASAVLNETLLEGGEWCACTWSPPTPVSPSQRIIKSVKVLPPSAAFPLAGFGQRVTRVVIIRKTVREGVWGWNWALFLERYYSGRLEGVSARASVSTGPEGVWGWERERVCRDVNKT